jgi:hypothetical protein
MGCGASAPQHATSQPELRTKAAAALTAAAKSASKAAEQAVEKEAEHAIGEAVRLFELQRHAAVMGVPRACYSHDPTMQAAGGLDPAEALDTELGKLEAEVDSASLVRRPACRCRPTAGQHRSALFLYFT